MSFQILVQVLQILRELTIKLQLKAIDVVSAYKLVNNVISRFKSMRANSVIEFKKQFEEAARIGKQFHGDQFELTTPRLSGRQRHRSNPPSSTPEEYYRSTLYNEFLSHVVSELGSGVVVPEDLAKAVDLFKGDLPHAVMFITEYDL